MISHICAIACAPTLRGYFLKLATPATTHCVITAIPLTTDVRSVRLEDSYSPELID